MDGSLRKKQLVCLLFLVVSCYLLTGCPDAPGNDDSPPESCSNYLDDTQQWFYLYAPIRNDDFEHAMDVPDSFNCWNASISSDTDRDVFKIWLKAGYNRIRLTNLTNDLELYLYDSSEGPQGSSTLNGTEDEIIDISPSVDGDYYIVVYSYNATMSNYIIIVSRP